MTRKGVGQREFVWESKENYQIFLYLLMHTFGVIVFFAWFLYVAIDGSKFGSQPSCNNFVKFVFYFVSVRATITWLRIIMILFFAGAIPFFLFILGFLILAPKNWTKGCTKALHKLFETFPGLGWVRYIIGIP